MSQNKPATAELSRALKVINESRIWPAHAVRHYSDQAFHVGVLEAHLELALGALRRGARDEVEQLLESADAHIIKWRAEHVR